MAESEPVVAGASEPLYVTVRRALAESQREIAALPFEPDAEIPYALRSTEIDAWSLVDSLETLAERIEREAREYVRLVPSFKNAMARAHTGLYMRMNRAERILKADLLREMYDLTPKQIDDALAMLDHLASVGVKFGGYSYGEMAGQTAGLREILARARRVATEVERVRKSIEGVAA